MGMFQNRYHESESRSFASYMDWEAAGVTEKQMYTPPKSGRMMIDIVPFVVATKNHPLVAKKKMKVGDLDYALDLYVHKNVGPNRTPVVCLRNFNKVCPVCEFYKDRLKAGGKDDEQAVAIKGKRRIIYNVIDATADSMKIKIFEVAHFSFEKEVLDEAKAEGERMGLAYLDYADPDEGYTIKCRTSEDDSGKYTFTKFKNFSFEKRESGLITPKLIKKAVQLDKYLIILSADEIDALLYSPDDPVQKDDDDDDDEDEKPRKHRGHSVSDDDDDDESPRARRKKSDDDEEEEEEEDEEPRRKRSSKSSDDDDDDNEDPPKKKKRRVVEEEEDDDETPPKRKSRKSEEEDDDDEEDDTPRRRKSSDEDDEEDTPPKRKSKKKAPDEDDDDDEEEEETEIISRPTKGKDDDDCPHDHRFGVDTDKFDECEECKVWDLCAAALKKNKKKKGK